MKTIWKVFALFVIFSISSTMAVLANETCDFSNAIGLRDAGEQYLVVSKTDGTVGLTFKAYEDTSCNTVWSLTVEQEVHSYSFDLIDGQEVLNIAVQEAFGNQYANTVYSYHDGLQYQYDIIYTTKDQNDVIVYLKQLSLELFLVGQIDESLRVLNPSTGSQSVIGGVGQVVQVAFNGDYAFVLTDEMLYSVASPESNHFSWYLPNELVPDSSYVDTISLAAGNVLWVATDTGEYFLTIKDGFIQR